MLLQAYISTLGDRGLPVRENHHAYFTYPEYPGSISTRGDRGLHFAE